MALTPTEEAQVRDLIAQDDELLNLAANEPVIISKLGATKVTLSDLAAASGCSLADLFLTRQGTDDKSITAQLIRDFMMANGVTPPQFDKDTSLVTTEFAKMMGLEASNVTSFQGALTGVPAHFGGMVYSYGAAAPSYSLPQAGVNVPRGASVKIAAMGNLPLNVVPQGADTIQGADGSNLGGLFSIPVGTEVWATVVDVGKWFVHGTGQLSKSSQFATSLATNGYTRLPGGVIIQWGSVNTAGNLFFQVNYPITFPSGVASVVATADANNSQNLPNTAAVLYSSSGASFFTAGILGANAYVPGGMRWIAIGY